MMEILRTLLVSFILVGVGGTVLAAATDGLHAFTTEGARRYEISHHPRPVPAVTLETQSGQHIDVSDLRGRWLLVDFIYTRCMTYCSVLGTEFAQIQTHLATPIAQGKLQLLSISFDPDHDGPAELSGYMRRMHDDGTGWIAARPVNSGDLEQLKRVFGITVIPDGLGGYTHNAGIDLVNPQGQLVAVYGLDDLPQIERDMMRNLG